MVCPDAAWQPVGASVERVRRLDPIQTKQTDRLKARIVRALLTFSVLVATGWGGECIPYSEARKHVGRYKCVSGKVLKVKVGKSGTTFFDFCEDYRMCPFTVVVFARDLKHVGDVRQLEGRTVEIHGTVQEYDNRAEIVLQRANQLGGNAGQIPPLPKGYDVEKKGRYSAGKFRHKSSKPERKRQPARVETEERTEEPEE